LTIRAVIGLGNPGRKYQASRHNAGFQVLDQLAAAEGLTWSMKRDFKAEIAEWRRGSDRVFLVKPQTFMNLSGESVSAFRSFYKLEPEDLLIAYDDMDLPLGRLRLRMAGGAGGHNGMKSILGVLGSNQVDRLRIGVGRPDRGDEVGFVLGRFSADEAKTMAQAIDFSVDSIRSWLTQGMSATMNLFNRNDSETESKPEGM
jgi:peptidyl-tRNA hydrolase, PTH1 family